MTSADYSKSFDVIYYDIYLCKIHDGHSVALLCRIVEMEVGRWTGRPFCSFGKS